MKWLFSLFAVGCFFLVSTAPTPSDGACFRKCRVGHRPLVRVVKAPFRLLSIRRCRGN